MRSRVGRAKPRSLFSRFTKPPYPLPKRSPDHALRPRQPGLDECRSCFKGLTAPSDTRGPESLFFGYNDVEGGFEGPWPVRRPRQEEPRPQQAWRNTVRIARTIGNAAVCRTFMRSVFFITTTRGDGFIDRNRGYRPRVQRARSAVLRVFLTLQRWPRSVRRLAFLGSENRRPPPPRTRCSWRFTRSVPSSRSISRQ